MSPELVRAARALLSWKQEDLAKAAGLSLPAINNFERGIATPRMDTLNNIRKALEEGGIEFLPHEGLRKRTEIFEMRKCEGATFVSDANLDLFDCMKGPSDEVCWITEDDNKWRTMQYAELDKYPQLQAQRQWQQRILIADDVQVVHRDHKYYRCLPRQLIGRVTYMVYKDRFCLFLFDAQRTVVIRNPSIAEAYQKQFDYLWSIARPLSRKVIRTQKWDYLWGKGEKPLGG